MAKQCCDRDHDHDGNCDQHPEKKRWPRDDYYVDHPKTRNCPASPGWMFHLCEGTARRTFTWGDYYEEWVWCTTCGDWYLSMIINMKAVAKLELKDEHPDR